MSSVGIRALQQHASEVVRRAASGETVDITERGRPVARLIPHTDPTLAHLVTTGRVRPATSRLTDQPLPVPAEPGAPPLTELLAAAREPER